MVVEKDMICVNCEKFALKSVRRGEIYHFVSMAMFNGLKIGTINRR